MQQRICFNKKVGYLAFFIVVLCVAALALNLISRQKTSTNSRASTQSLQTANPPLPTSIPRCNTFGTIVVQDTQTGALWSWGSKSVNNDGNAPCGSEKYLKGTPTPIITPLIFPSDSAAHSYTEYYVMLYTSACYKHGIGISLEGNTLKAKMQSELVKVPSYLVGTRVKNTLCSEKNSHSCVQNRYAQISGDRWHLGYFKEFRGGQNVCASNKVSNGARSLSQ